MLLFKQVFEGKGHLRIRAVSWGPMTAIALTTAKRGEESHDPASHSRTEQEVLRFTSLRSG